MPFSAKLSSFPKLGALPSLLLALSLLRPQAQ
jgi:hypothetical protein